MSYLAGGHQWDLWAFRWQKLVTALDSGGGGP